MATIVYQALAPEHRDDAGSGSEAQIFAADIDGHIPFRESRITTFFCDQTNPDSVRALLADPALQGDFARQLARHDEARPIAVGADLSCTSSI